MKQYNEAFVGIDTAKNKSGSEGIHDPNQGTNAV